MSRTNPRLVQLRDEFVALRDGLQYLDDLAGVEKRSLTEDEQASYDAAVTRMEAIDADIKSTLERQERFDKVSTVVASIEDIPERVPAPAAAIDGLARTESRLVTYDPAKAGKPFSAAVAVEELGDWALTRARLQLGKITEDEARSEMLTRAVVHGDSGDALQPVTIEGDLINYIDSNRYAVNAARRLPMPMNRSQTFKRPRVSAHTSVGTQAAEGDVLSSAAFTTTGDTVTKVTKGGVISMSEQEIDWSEPAILGLAIQDLAAQYAIDTDDFFCTALEAAFTASTQTVVSLTAAADVFIAALAASASSVYSNSKKLPDTLFVAIDRWAYLASLCDANDRPIFPISAPQNVPGSGAGIASFTGFSIMGLQVVVDPNLTTAVWGTAASQLAEFYEQNKGLLTINSPSTLEVQYAYRGYVAANVYTAGVNAMETA